MKHDELGQIIRTLPPAQQTLDFEDVHPWQSLPESDRQACREAIAALLTHIAIETRRRSEPKPTVERTPTTQSTGERK